MGRIKGLSFDMYRTLIDTKDFHEQSVREFLIRNGADSVEVNAFHFRWDEIYDEICRSLSGRGDAHLKAGNPPALPGFMRLYDVSIESLRRTMHEFGVKGDPKSGVDMWLSKYKDADLFPEVEEVLHTLAGKYPIVVTSNVDDDDPGYACFRKKNLPVKAIITSESSKSYKPDRKIFEDALSILGCRPEEALHVGDSQRADVLGGKNAGMLTAWVRRRPSERKEQGLPAPDYEVTNLRELLELDLQLR